MPRIKIEDLPEDMTISKEGMRKITGGLLSKELPLIPHPLNSDHSTGSDVKSITITCNVGRIEVA